MIMPPVRLLLVLCIFFSFSTLNISCQWPVVSADKSAERSMGIPFYATSFSVCVHAFVRAWCIFLRFSLTFNI